MLRTATLTILAVVAASVMSGTALGHHSFAMFDQDRLVEYHGTVTEYHWINPHAHIILQIGPAPQVNAALAGEYDVECAGVGAMRLQGWSSSTLKPGDKVTIVGNPLRNGDKGVSLFYATLADGTRIYRDIARPRPNGPRVLPLGTS